MQLIYLIPNSQAYLHGDTTSALNTLNKIGKPLKAIITEQTFEEFPDIEQKKGQEEVNERFMDIKNSPVLIKVNII